MVKIAQIAMVLINFYCLGQNNEFLFKDFNNPALLKQINTPALYTKHSIINHDFGIKAHKIGAVIKFRRQPIQASYHQYGYTKYKEQKFTLSTAQKISSKINFGLNLNLHRAISPGFQKQYTVSIDLGWNYVNKHYEVELFIENPFNSSYVKNDITSRLILCGRYHWNVNLTSIIQAEESLAPNSHVQHELKYSYENSFNMSIIHALTISQYGIKIGYIKEPFEFYTSYKTHAWANRIGLSLIYHPTNG